MAAVSRDNLKTIKKNLTTPALFKKTDHANKACFSYDYKQYGCLETWDIAWQKLKDLPHNENIFHELILGDRVVKPYLDVEWYTEKFPELRPDKVMMDIKDIIINIFENEWDNKLDYKDIYVASCHRKKTEGYKNSFRIIISTHPTLVFMNTNCASYLAKRIKKLCGEKFNENIIDGGVYHKLQNIRFVSHCKAGEYVPMQKMNGGDEDKEFIITNVDPQYIVLATPEQKDTKYKDIKNTSSVDFENPDNIKYVMDKIKSIHPSSIIERIDVNNFIQLNYTDRNESCFCKEGLKHDRIGFFCFIKGGLIYVGCHSGNCVDGENKKIVKTLGSLSATSNTKYEAVSHKDKFLLDPNDVRDFIHDGSYGMSNMFKEMYLNPKRIKWINDTNNGTTFYWDGKLWKHDECAFLEVLITSTCARVLKDFIAIFNKANDDMSLEMDEGTLKVCKGMIHKLNEGTNLSNIIRFLRPLLNDPDFIKIKDIHPYFLSCKNGVVDLKTGVLRDCVPEDNMTKSLDVAYDEHARTDDFDTFVRQITSDIDGEDLDLYNYIRWMIGYSMQGSPVKKTFFILYGKYGYNGKSMLLNMIKEVLKGGGYAVTMDKSVVINGPQKSAGSHSTEIVDLENSRFGMLTETSEDAVINDSQVKILTGITDKLSVRQIYGKQKEFSPTFVPIISSNHKLKINLKDKAMYERCILVPFRLSFMETPDKNNVAERQADTLLVEKLNKNKEGTLKWLIQCSLYYHENKDLPVPDTIIKAKKEYKRDMDDYADFLERYVENTGITKDYVVMDDLLIRFREFANDNRIVFDRRKSEKMLLDCLNVKQEDFKSKMKFTGYKFREED